MVEIPTPSSRVSVRFSVEFAGAYIWYTSVRVQIIAVQNFTWFTFDIAIDNWSTREVCTRAREKWAFSHLIKSMYRVKRMQRAVAEAWGNHEACGIRRLYSIATYWFENRNTQTLTGFLIIISLFSEKFLPNLIEKAEQKSQLDLRGMGRDRLAAYRKRSHQPEVVIWDRLLSPQCEG